jgi:hypothetical protein
MILQKLILQCVTIAVHVLLSVRFRPFFLMKREKGRLWIITKEEWEWVWDREWEEDEDEDRVEGED